MQPITKAELDIHIQRTKQRGEMGARLSRTRIESQMKSVRDQIQIWEAEARDLERELTIHLIAMDTLRYK